MSTMAQFGAKARSPTNTTLLTATIVSLPGMGVSPFFARPRARRHHDATKCRVQGAECHRGKKSSPAQHVPQEGKDPAGC